MSNSVRDAVTINAQKLLVQLAAGHDFDQTKKRIGPRNCERRLMVPHVLYGPGLHTGLHTVDVPADSEVVIYQNPSKPRSRSARLACIHFPMRDRQVVIYPGGFVQNQRLDGRTTMGRTYQGSVAGDISW